MAEIIYDGQEYWRIAHRFHNGKRKGVKLITFAALNHMKQLHPQTQAVRGSVNKFIARHQTKSPGHFPNDDGPTYA